MKKFIIIGILLIFLLGLILSFQTLFRSNNLKIVICDVGQGDAIYIRTPKNSDILIDSGPDDRVINCLSKNMPFWDRTIEVVILTHPDSDHITGFLDVIKRYSVKYFYTSKVDVDTLVYAEFLKLLKEHGIERKYIWQEDKIGFEDGLVLTTLWSPQEWSGETTNSYSVVNLLRYKEFEALFTGDLDAKELEDVVGLIDDDIEVLKVPHHGSRHGLNKNVLSALSPKLAAISVGRKNRHGHPAEEVLDLLEEVEARVFRTDRDGEIRITSDGRSFKAMSFEH
jgi:competence protein ComEC